MADQTHDEHGNERSAAARWQGTTSAPPPTNPDAFATNFRALTPALYDFLNRLSGREETANALMRQVASQAAMNAANADQWPSIRAWLFARAYAALPSDTAAAAADPTPYIVPDLTLLPPVAPESGLDDMTRAVWRAISALPVEQHALLHLHTREAMVVGEAASVLGITEREATDRLQGLAPAVEAASRALFLIRFGRPRDPELDTLLASLNITRLTPEARATIEEYADRSPTAQEMLRTVPPPLTVYAALQPIPPPSAIAAEAIASALPWLPLVEEQTTALDMPTTALPENGNPAYHAEEQTVVTPIADGWQYGEQQPTEAYYGTQALDIPVRQRVMGEEPIYAPPRTTNRAVGPLALLGLLGVALIAVVGALVIFLVRGDSTSGPISVTATVSNTVTAPSPTTVLSPALATATALANLVGPATPLPTATTAPRPPGTAAVGSVTQPTLTDTPPLGTPTPLGTGTQAISTQAPLIAPPARVTQIVETPVPKVTPIPQETPTPRVTPVPTDTAAPTKPLTPATTATATTAPTAKATTPAPTKAVMTTAAGTTASGGTLTVDKGTIALGAQGNSGSVMLSNPGGASVTFTAKSSTTWLTAAPAGGSVPADGSLPVTLTISRAGLAPGSYSGTVTFATASGAVSTVSVTFTV